MKKLLFVILVVILAAFLFTGCLPVTPSEGEGEGEGEGEVTLLFDNEYTKASGETYIWCASVPIVTFSNPVGVDYVVYVAVKYYCEGCDEYEYDCMVPLSPNTDRTIWTGEIGGVGPICYPECEPICIVALLKHPCCPGEEVAQRIVTVDCTPPKANLAVTFYDCGDPCDQPDPCDLPVAGAYAVWTSSTTTECETIDCCEDDCSGVAGWSLFIDPNLCEGPCDEVSGVGCPIEATLDCGCLVYPDTGEKVVLVNWQIVDNVGNIANITATIVLDTDEIISLNYYPLTMGVAVPIVEGNCTEQE